MLSIWSWMFLERVCLVRIRSLSVLLLQMEYPDESKLLPFWQVYRWGAEQSNGPYRQVPLHYFPARSWSRVVNDPEEEAALIICVLKNPIRERSYH